MIERNASAVQVDGSAHESGWMKVGSASTGQRMPESSITGNMIGMLSCIAWNSDFALLETNRPMHMAARPRKMPTANSSRGEPLTGMSKPYTAMRMTTVTWPTRMVEKAAK